MKVNFKEWCSYVGGLHLSILYWTHRATVVQRNRNNILRVTAV